METPESLHIEMCKDPYRATNRREYDEQIINYLEIHGQLALRRSYEAFQTRNQTYLVSGGLVCHCRF
jgi:hypothetical protein